MALARPAGGIRRLSRSADGRIRNSWKAARMWGVIKIHPRWLWPHWSIAVKASSWAGWRLRILENPIPIDSSFSSVSNPESVWTALKNITTQLALFLAVTPPRSRLSPFHLHIRWCCRQGLVKFFLPQLEVVVVYQCTPPQRRSYCCWCCSPKSCFAACRKGPEGGGSSLGEWI